jgi:hypothetical protein
VAQHSPQDDGVETVEVGYLSVEPFEDERLGIHHTLLGVNTVILGASCSGTWSPATTSSHACR